MKKKDFSGKSRKECDEAALAKVYRCLTACEQSSIKLRKKMELEGYPSDSIDYALTSAAEKGFLSDARYLDLLVRNTLAQGKGMKNVIKEAEDLGIDPMTLESYVEYIQDQDISEVDRALDFLKRHPPRAKDVRASAFRKLATKGYSFDVASKASGIYCETLKNADN